MGETTYDKQTGYGPIPTKTSDKDTEKVRWASKQLAAATSSYNKWWKEASECYAFHAGHQFSKADLAMLEAKGRPAAAFNIAQSYIRLLSSWERNGHRTVRFLPRKMDDDNIAELGDFTTSVFEYVLDCCSGDSERSRAFMDMIIGGIGCMDLWLDRSINPHGELSVSRLDPAEVRWDQRARRINLEDTRWVAHVRKAERAELKRRHPDAAEQIDRYLADSDNMTLGSPNQSQPTTLFSPVSAKAEPSFEDARSQGRMGDREEIEVTEFQWYDEMPSIYYADPLGRGFGLLAEDAFDKFKKDYSDLRSKNMVSAQLTLPEEIETERVLTKQFKRMLYCGPDILLAGPDDLLGKRFTIQFMTGSWDVQEKMWFGFERVMMDPQRYLTKYANQLLEIMMFQAKGGLLAETDAFANVRQAEESYAKPGSITWLNSGAIARQAVMPKPKTELPPGSVELVDMAIKLNETVTGINPGASMGAVGGAGEMTGNVPAMTFRHRQTANMALVSVEFDAYDRYRLSEAKLILEHLPLIADGRLARVGDMDDGKVVKLNFDPFELQYDLKLDDQAERDPQIREMYSQFILQMAPTLIRTENFLPEMIDFLPLPSRLRRKLKQAMEDQAKAKAQMAQQGLGGGKGQSPLEIHANVAKLEAEVELAKAKALAVVQNAQTDRMRLEIDSMTPADPNVNPNSTGTPLSKPPQN